MPDLKEKVIQIINEYEMIENNDKIVVRCLWRPGLYLPFRCFKKNKRRKNI